MAFESKLPGVGILCLLLITNCICARAQSTDEKKYFAVVGVFAIPANASRLVEQLNLRGENASFFVGKNNGYHYVYVLEDKSKELVRSKVIALQNDSFTKGSWIFEETTLPGLVNQPLLDSAEHAASAQPAATEPIMSTPVPSSTHIPEDSSPDIFLSLYNAQNDQVVDGKVQVIDLEKNSLVTELKGNTYLDTKTLPKKKGHVKLICDALGFKRLSIDLDLNSPVAPETESFVVDMGTSLMVNFPLVKYQRGDIRPLYSVYFYNDATVMQPESTYELKQLADMMIRNPNYRIRLHGHSNGGYLGKFSVPAWSEDFFNIRGSLKQRSGTAVVLSRSRADAIRQYLVLQGIGIDRVETKGWGAKRPLYDKNSANAKRNVRVEVEIIED